MIPDFFYWVIAIVVGNYVYDRWFKYKDKENKDDQNRN